MAAFLIVSVISVGTTLAALGLARRGDALLTSVAAPGLAAGVMLWIALAEIGPGSAAAIGTTTTVLAMAVGVAVVRLATLIAHRPTVAAGVAPVIGVALVLHDVPEGLAVGALLTGAGFVAALPMVLAVTAHNLPEKLAFVAPAQLEGARTGPVLAAATVPEPLGAALAGVSSAAAPAVVPLLVAMAGGMMLAVAVGTLPTMARRAAAWRPFLGAGTMGVFSMALLTFATS
jgi:ZIP family zinc transporter